MTIQIDKGIPVPPANMRRKFKYPWRDMDVGDSFFVPEELAASASRSGRFYGLRHGKKFSRGAVTEGGVKGVRVWRIE